MRVVQIFLFCLILPFLFGFISEKPMEKTNDYAQVTKDPRLVKALDLMVGTTGEWAKQAILGNNVSGKPVKVLFKNLSSLSPAYATFDALGWQGANGQLFIYLNMKHQNAPAEALASTLSHEAVHQDALCSLEEETYAWGYEADVWIQMKKRNPELNNLSNTIPLVKRLNTLETLFKGSNYTTASIRKVVASNPGYQGLPLYSPGFGQ
jgi:hypothetical protein